MVKTKKKRIKVEGLDSLYISLTNPKEKRKNILQSIKNSLIMQDELDVISQIRKEKRQLLNEIRKTLNSINSDYQSLKKNLPDVKNVISFTEKELAELENEVRMLRHSVRDDEKIIERVEDAEESIKEGSLRKKKTHHKKKTTTNETTTTKTTTKYIPREKLGTTIKKVEAKENPQTLSKLDRIKNNLRVIEAKLEKL